MNWQNLAALGIIATITLGVLAGYRTMTFALPALVGIVVVIVIASTTMMRMLAISEGVLLAEAVAISLTAPLLFEQSIEFELVGGAVALAFVAGLFVHLAVDGNYSAPVVSAKKSDD